MKKFKSLLVCSIAAMSVGALGGCKWPWQKNKDDGKTDVAYFSFSIGLKSGANIISLGSTNESIAIYDNGVDTANRSYSYASTNPSVATIDANGKITPVSEGRVNFTVTEANSKISKALKKEIVVSKNVNASDGGYNFSGGTTEPELNKRAEILGKLEKYAMDTHLTGITLFENGGLVKYSDRVEIPTKGQQFIEGFGFGILTDGKLNGRLTGTEGGQEYPDFYHSAFGQDPLKINQYSAAGSQISDLAGYITSSYWGTRLNNAKDNYEWYPLLATDEVYVPTFNSDGTISYASEKTRNSAPIPAEPHNDTELYKKWRIYVKTDGDVNGSNLKFTTASSTLSANGFNRGVTIDDYMFIYQLLLTGSNNILRGTEMANDTSYGIRGAQRFFNESKAGDDAAKQAKWNEFITPDEKGNIKLGLAKGSDDNGYYIDIELINAIDAFTAMYTLSSNITSPMPKELFMGSKALKTTMKDAIEAYGTFDDGGNNAIIDKTICLGAYTLTKWVKESEIVFARNDNWFEYTPSGQKYQIPGVYMRKVDVSTDTEKNWKQLEAGNIDSAGVPTSKVEENRGRDGIYETKGDATFKLNINSCTQEEWDKLFGPGGSIHPDTDYWKIKPWMSNSDFLDGLFYSIDREAFARKRGVNPSVNYFSNAYQMRNAEKGSSYNATQAHKDAVKGYSEDYGYDLNKAIDCFRNAVKQLSKDPDKLVLGSKENPTIINIHIRWMYSTDKKEYGEDIAYYFERAFNDDSVCGGRVKLKVEQDYVTFWEDVYTKWMMQGRFDLAFGAISGNTYNPLNFMEVLKSDNSSQFTLNWGTDTSKVDEKNPIIYDGKKWSFDALWEVADHGGIVEHGEKIDPVRECTFNWPVNLEKTDIENDLYKGFNLELPVDFAEFEKDGSKAEFDVNRVDCYVFGYGNITLGEKGEHCYYDKANKVIKVEVDETTAQKINEAIKTHKHYQSPYNEAWQENPFIMDQFDQLFNWELYYELKINGGSASVNYCAVTMSDD